MLKAVDYLLAKGAMDNRTPIDKLIGACARPEEKAVRDILRDQPEIARTLTERDHSNLSALARMGRLSRSSSCWMPGLISKRAQTISMPLHFTTQPRTVISRCLSSCSHAAHDAT